MILNRSVAWMRSHLKTSVFLLFAVLGFFLYRPALDTPFTYDDYHQILQNPSVRGLNDVPSFFTEVASASRVAEWTVHYRPLLLTTFAFNYALGGTNPAGYHLFNLVFHLGSAFLVFLLVNLLLTPRVREGEGIRFLIPGFISGLVLLIHPFNAEVVNYVTARSSVMAAFFYLLSFYAYVRFRQRGERAIDLAVSLIAFLLGLMTKEILITLPLTLLIYEWLLSPERGDFFKRRAIGMVPFLLLPILYLWVRKEVVGSVGPSFLAREPWENLLIQIKVLAETWRMLFFPSNLSIVHPNPLFLGMGDVGFWGALFFLVLTWGVLAGCVFWGGRVFRFIGFWLAWFYVTLLPTTLVPLLAVLQENRGYIAGVAFAAILGTITAGGMERGRWRRGVAMGILGVLFIGYGIGIYDRNRVWDDEVTLWRDAVRKAPETHGSHFGLASAYQRKREWDRAEKEYLEAIRMGSKDALLYNDLGTLYGETGRLNLAIPRFEEAIRLGPNYDVSYGNLGTAYLMTGKEDQAIQAFLSALRINPLNETALIQLGSFHSRRGEAAQARSLYLSALRRNENLPRIQLAMGLFYRQEGDHPRAVSAFEKAASLSPLFTEAHLRMGQEYLLLNEPRKAAGAFQRALDLAPHDGLRYIMLGKLYEQLGEGEKARELYRRVLALDPGVGRNREAIAAARKELGMEGRP